VLASSDLKAENSITEPTKVAPVEQALEVSASDFTYKLAPQSLTVLRIGTPIRVIR
jgi:alpha-L-arabinofuranosidase